MTHANVCVHKLREWQKKYSNVSVLALRRAYLQVHVHQSLCACASIQAVIFKKRRYCLTCMGFELNVPPSIIQAIVDATLSKDNAIRVAISTYIENH